jgi:predicted ATP-grasp superfamily ATP-dependent carboligase
MNADDLKEKYDAMREKYGEPPLIQERVTGEEYGVEMIAEKGEPRALVVHHRLRSLSPTGGASVLKEIEPAGALRDMLITYAKKLVHELLWEGPIMVEFKVDSDTRTPKLMEINGRFWGSLPLSVAAGVDMPYLYYRLVTGGGLPKDVVTPKEGVTTRHMMGDVLHLFRVLFARDPMRARMYPKRLQSLRDFFNTPKGTRGDVWLWNDPKPAFAELLDIVKKSFRR